jgi:hypothetical protein
MAAKIRPKHPGLSLSETASFPSERILDGLFNGIFRIPDIPCNGWNGSIA